MKKRILQNANSIPMSAFKTLNKLQQIKNLLERNHRLYNKSDYSPFFIIGSGRSGNTLLRSILVTHPSLAIPPESYVLQSVYRKFHLYRNLAWEDLVKIVVAEFESHKQFYHWDINLIPIYQKVLTLPKEDRTLAKIVDSIYRHYAAEKFPGATLWGDKTPMNTLYLNWIDKMFPKSLYIHIIRDGRDVVSSYLKAGIYDNVKDASWRWMASVERAKRLGQALSNERYMELRYEDLVSSPEVEVKKVCNFLGIQFHDNMLKPQENASKLGDAAKLSHHSNLYQPINSSSIGKWKKNLDTNQKKIVQKKISRLLEGLGYEE